MKKQVSKSDFKPKVFAYLRQVVETGKDLIITDHGEPVVKIIPFREDKKDPIESLRGSVTKYENPFQPVDEKWEAEED